MKWARLQRRRWPQFKMLAHIPNGGPRSRLAGAILLAEGVAPGYPDYLLDCPAAGFHGLRIELKTANNSLSADQRRWIDDLRDMGYCAFACRGWARAAALLTAYVGGPAHRDALLAAQAAGRYWQRELS